MDFLGMDQNFINRYLNEGFSGGEKKRMEIMQMLTLKPAFAVLDETDSGLDIDALKVVARGVRRLSGPDFGCLVITHYQRILDYLKPDHVHVMYDGRIVLSGGGDIAHTLEERGYEWIREEYGEEVANG
jgi:Fe-S cluster assembly ATP-binding protein